MNCSIRSRWFRLLRLMTLVLVSLMVHVPYLPLSNANVDIGFYERSIFSSVMPMLFPTFLKAPCVLFSVITFVLASL